MAISNQQPSNFLGYATLGLQFLRTAENCCAELVKRENTLTVVFDAATTFDLAAYEEATGWSDHKIGVPVLFTFFHGIELTLKAFLAHAGSSSKSHKLTQLLANFEGLHPDKELGRLINVWVCNFDAKSPLGKFMTRNEVTIDNWYETMKYPETANGVPISHTELKYQGSDGVKFWQSIGEAAEAIRLECVSFARATGVAAGCGA